MDATEHLPPGDPKLVQNIVNHLKAKGIFDQFRRDCLADVDTRPAYQNLRQRVDGYVSKFLAQQTWPPELNKNQLRDSLRRQINESGMLAMGVDHLVEQVVNPKVYQVFYPHIESMVKKFLGIESPADSQTSSQKKEENRSGPSHERVGQPRNMLPFPFPSQLPNPFPQGIKEEKVCEKTEAPKQETSLPLGDSKPVETSVTSTEVEKQAAKKENKPNPEPSTSSQEKSPSKLQATESPLASESGRSDVQKVSEPAQYSVVEKEAVLQKDSIKDEHAIPMLKSTPALLSESKPVTEVVDEKKVPVPCNLDSEESDSMDSVGGSSTGRLVIDMKGYEREGTPSESNSRDSFKFSREMKGKDHELLASSMEQRFSENSKSADSFLGKMESLGKHSPAPLDTDDSVSNHDSEKGRRGETSIPVEKNRAADSAKSKSPKSSGSSTSRDSFSDSSKSKTHSKTEKSVTKPSASPSSSEGKKHTKSYDQKGKLGESKKHSSEDDKHRSRDKNKPSSSEKSRQRQDSKSSSKDYKSESESSKSKHQKSSKSSKEKESQKTIKHKPSSEEMELSKSKTHKSPRNEESKTVIKERTTSHGQPEAGDALKGEQTKDKPTSEKLKDEKLSSKPVDVSETSSDEGEKDSSGKATDTSLSQSSERRDSSDSEDDHSGYKRRGSLKTSADKDQVSLNSSPEQRSDQQKDSQQARDLGASNSSKRDSGDEMKQVESHDELQQNPPLNIREDSSYTEKNTSANDVDDSNDAKSVGALSDVTVSSVHTSDLSSFDDEISLSSEDELKVALEKPNKKLSLREVKEMAKAYDHIRRKSSEEKDGTEVHYEKELEEATALVCPKTPDMQSTSSSTTTTPAKTPSEEVSSPDMKSEMKMSLRRQRRINPRYSSEEFSSIFTKMDRVRSTVENNEFDSPASNLQRTRQIRRKRSTYKNEDATPVLQENGYHASEYDSSELNKDHEDNKPSVLNGAAEDAERNTTTTDGSLTNPVPETQLPIRKRLKSEEKQSKENLDDKSFWCQMPPEKTQQEEKHQRRPTRSRSSSDHSSQRYDSSDLYKPRPVISSTSRRSRGASSLTLEDDIQKMNTNLNKDTISDDSNSLDSLESSYSRGSRKRGHSFSSDVSVMATKRRRK